LNDGPLPGAKRISSIAGILGILKLKLGNYAHKIVVHHMAAQPSHGLGFGDNNDVFICECQRNLLSFNPGAKRISSIAGILGILKLKLGNYAHKIETQEVAIWPRNRPMGWALVITMMYLSVSVSATS
jgi:hypothetical protein